MDQEERKPDGMPPQDPPPAAEQPPAEQSGGDAPGGGGASVEEMAGMSIYTLAEPPKKEEHIIAALGHFLVGIFPIVTWILWLVKGKESKFLSVNLVQASVLGLINFGQLIILGFFLSCFTFGLTGLISFVICIAIIVYGILAGIKANDGKVVAYPLVKAIAKPEI